MKRKCLLMVMLLCIGWGAAVLVEPKTIEKAAGGGSLITRRDYFAAEALVLFDKVKYPSSLDDNGAYAKVIAYEAYRIADAMIAEARRPRFPEIPRRDMIGRIEQGVEPQQGGGKR